MRFKRPEMKAELDAVHPEVRFAVDALDRWSLGERVPEVVVTHVLRTPKMQEDIYWKSVAEAQGLSEMAARVEARKKFSWHLIGCGVDIRNTNYTANELAAVMAWLRDGREMPKWEILQHDVGRGDHIHVGIRDFAWRKAREAVS